jgi:hypothetical protein
LVARTENTNITAANFLPAIRKDDGVNSGVYTQLFNVDGTTPYYYLIA